MKRIIAFTLIASLALLVSGCGSSADAGAENAPAVDKAKDSRTLKEGAAASPTQE